MNFFLNIDDGFIAAIAFSVSFISGKFLLFIIDFNQTIAVRSISLITGLILKFTSRFNSLFVSILISLLVVTNIALQSSNFLYSLPFLNLIIAETDFTSFSITFWLVFLFLYELNKFSLSFFSSITFLYFFSSYSGTSTTSIPKFTNNVSKLFNKCLTSACFTIIF